MTFEQENLKIYYYGDYDTLWLVYNNNDIEIYNKLIDVWHLHLNKSRRLKGKIKRLELIYETLAHARAK